MRVVVLGAGVIGVTTAYALLQDGHDVVVVEKADGSALGTSYANAGQISPALSAPWAVPGLLPKAIKWAFEKYPPLVIGRTPNWEMIRWLWRMWRSANAERYGSSKRSMVELGEYSRDRLHVMQEKLNLEFAGRARGTYVLFRSDAQRRTYEADLQTLSDMGVPASMLSRDELQQHEPNMEVTAAGLLGAAHLPGDETGDCRRFTEGLAAACASEGVQFLYGVTVKDIKTNGNRVVEIETSRGSLQADVVVSCLGTGTNRVFSKVGLRVPIYPVKGYSLTISADSEAVGPLSTVSDETYKVGITFLGDRIRVGGTAELAGYNLSRPDRRFDGLLFVVRDLFRSIPQEAIQTAERWSGLRPMTADGPPVIGRTAFENLIVNTGHGTLGWTMACGAAQVVADLVGERRPAVDVAAFSPTR